jgi:hypothetical protein
MRATETPAFCFDAVDQPFKKPAGPAFNPVSRNVARNQKCEGGAERGAREIPHAAPEWTEEGTTSKTEDYTRNESDSAQCKEHHVADRRPRTERTEPYIQRLQIDLLAVKDGPPRHCCEHQRQNNAQQ